MTKMNIILINIAHFLDTSLFYFLVEFEVMLVAICNVIVIVVFYDLVETELCYTYMCCLWLVCNNLLVCNLPYGDFSVI